MAQTRLLSVVAKEEVMENDVVQMEKLLATLGKILVLMKKKQFGRRRDMARNKIESDHLSALLHSMHHVDNLILKIQNLLNRISSHSLFIQHQLELRNFQLV